MSLIVLRLKASLGMHRNSYVHQGFVWSTQNCEVIQAGLTWPFKFMIKSDGAGALVENPDKHLKKTLGMIILEEFHLAYPLPT
jgi:hypothetical protein